MPPEHDDAAPTEATPPGSTHGHGRFLPGSMLANRYRIVALAGRGGMGEVYRADDLKIGQPVALKFLPGDLERDADRLQRLLGEVRIARQVSHPNVCRVYDVGEFQGHHFITMEYVDGEDLAALLTMNLLTICTPLTLDFSRWYGWRTGVVAFLLLAIAVWGFRAVMGRRRILSAAMLEG